MSKWEMQDEWSWKRGQVSKGKFFENKKSTFFFFIIIPGAL